MLQDREVARFLRVFEDARRELKEELSNLAFRGRMDTFTAREMQATMAQVEASIGQLKERLGMALSASEQVSRSRALENLVGVLKGAEKQFAGLGGVIETAALRRLAEQNGLLLDKYSLNRYGSQIIEAIQNELTVGLARRQTLDQIVERLAGGQNSVLAGMKPRAELIARMELARAYDQAHQASLEEAAAVLDDPDDPDPLLAMADEYFDHRNHPFSRVIHGQTRPVKGVWRVAVAEVDKIANRLKKSSGGVVWPIIGGFYEGATYPAHFRDRGRQVPYRKSWDEGNPLIIGSFKGGEDILGAQGKPYGGSPRMDDKAKQLVQEGLLEIHPSVLGQEYLDARRSAVFGMTQIPESVIEVLKNQDWRVTLKDGLDKAGRIFGRIDPGENISPTVALEPFLPSWSRAVAPAKTVCHEAAHSLDLLIGGKNRQGIWQFGLSNQQKWLDWWKSNTEIPKGQTKSRLERWLNKIGVTSTRPLRDPHEAWAEVVGQIWLNDFGRNSLAGRWPALLDLVNEMTQNATQRKPIL